MFKHGLRGLQPQDLSARGARMYKYVGFDALFPLV